MQCSGSVNQPVAEVRACLPANRGENRTKTISSAKDKSSRGSYVQVVAIIRELITLNIHTLL